MHDIREEVVSFQGGRLVEFAEKWKEITQDPEILSTVQGLAIEFDDVQELGKQIEIRQHKLTESEKKVIDSEIKKLASKKVITQCQPEPQQFVSPIFVRPKKDGTHRMILNLKNLNQNVTYEHFKMETLQTALKLVTPGCYMASIDLKDAYYSVAIKEDHRKYLRFQWEDELWQFNCMPNGLALAPRKFTKLLKPVFATLREKGHLSSAFLDDSLLLAETRVLCTQNIVDTVTQLRSLGFIIHPDKSVLAPTKRIQYLGVVIDSETMTVKLTLERANDLVSSCRSVIKKESISIRELASVIGKIVASFPAVMYGPLHYRQMEKEKKNALALNAGKFERHMTLSSQAKAELSWWIDNTATAFNVIEQTDPVITLTSDASKTGWGCTCKQVRSGGEWLPEEREFHINYLELKAAWFALKCFVEQVKGKHVRIMIDNTTAVACINHMGTSHSDACNLITHTIWQWCIDNYVWLSAAYIPGKENTAADEESRKTNLDAEWKLNSEFLRAALEKLKEEPVVDLFASRLNKQMKQYISFRPDPEALAVDAFSLSWQDLHFYAFPPFSVITAVLRKVMRDRARGIIVVPRWKTQVWWPMLMRLLDQDPVPLPMKNSTLSLPPQPRKTHHLLPRLQLLVCKISARDTSSKDAPRKPQNC